MTSANLTSQVVQPTVMQQSAAILQRKCACGKSGTTIPCPQCTKKKNQIQRKPANTLNSNNSNNTQQFSNTSFAAPPSVNKVISSSGRQLESSLRQDLEQHFAHDFSRVRIHSGSSAERSTKELNALAYTAGQNVVFAAGQFSPGTQSGRRLIAHELTHVVQQKNANNVLQNRLEVGSADNKYEREADTMADSFINSNAKTRAPRSISPVAPNIQRACGSQAIDSPTGCDFSSGSVSGLRYLFVVSCDDFAIGNEADLRRDAASILPGEVVEIHGLASSDGDPVFNMNLSCARALKAKTVIQQELVRLGVSATLEVFNHGPVVGEFVQQRSVVVTRRAPQSVPEPEPEPETEALPKCGPDATDWFVREVTSALVDPAIIAVKSNMLHADSLASRYGTTAAAIAEGGVTARLLAEEARLNVTGPPPPARNTTINSQLARGAAVGAVATAAVTPSGIFDRRNIDTPRILLAIQSAASGWAALVTHGATYDFKAHVMDHPTSANCPDDGCVPKEVGTVTLCPGMATENCYESDLPGNIFYALLGRHVGFSRNTLQLGSQFAELTDTTPRPARPVITWDTPDDTAAINLGFALPLPLTRADLCAVVPPAHSSLSLPTTPCADCPDVF